MELKFEYDYSQIEFSDLQTQTIYIFKRIKITYLNNTNISNNKTTKITITVT